MCKVRNVAVCDVAGDDLQVCSQGLTCCTRSMEVKMTLQARHVLNVTLAARLRVVRDIFSTRSTQFHGRSVLLV